MNNEKYRLLTKSDIDGMACGILLKELGIVDRIVFVHPKDIESGKAEVTGADITAGLPYREEAHLAFNHYPAVSASGRKENLIADKSAPSTSQVIYNHYGRDKFISISDDMLEAVNKEFSAKIDISEILYPTGWILLGYLIDQRTGLEKFKRFSSSNAEMLIKLTDYCREHTIWEVLSLPEVEERLDLYYSSVNTYKNQILRCSSVCCNLVITDTRNEKMIYPGNRFMVYALFPECNVSLQVSSEASTGEVTLVAGKSIIDRSYSRDIGKIMRKYGGGGHFNAGTCQSDGNEADEVVAKLIREMKYTPFQNIFAGYFNCYQYHCDVCIDTEKQEVPANTAPGELREIS